MDFKIITVVIISILIVTSTQTELIEERRYCEQFSGESNIN